MFAPRVGGISLVLACSALQLQVAGWPANRWRSTGAWRLRRGIGLGLHSATLRYFTVAYAPHEHKAYMFTDREYLVDVDTPHFRYGLPSLHGVLWSSPCCST